MDATSAAQVSGGGAAVDFPDRVAARHPVEGDRQAVVADRELGVVARDERCEGRVDAADAPPYRAPVEVSAGEHDRGVPAGHRYRHRCRVLVGECPERRQVAIGGPFHDPSQGSENVDDRSCGTAGMCGLSEHESASICCSLHLVCVTRGFKYLTISIIKSQCLTEGKVRYTKHINKGMS